MAKVSEKGEIATAAAAADSWSTGGADGGTGGAGDATRNDSSRPVDRCLSVVRNTRDRATVAWQRNKNALAHAFS